MSRPTSEVESQTDCSRCEGHGSLERDAYDYRGEHFTEVVECSACDGTGWLDDEPADVDLDACEPVDAEVAWEVRS
jgi:DnaJ-class molecular chaperone